LNDEEFDQKLQRLAALLGEDTSDLTWTVGQRSEVIERALSMSKVVEADLLAKGKLAAADYLAEQIHDWEMMREQMRSEMALDSVEEE
jgi:hypothetical protein